MSYIGNPVTTAAFLTDTFSGDGSTTSFTMQVAPATTASMLVSISGVLQAPASYNISGTTLTFTGAPPSGSSNISVRYLGVPASVVAGVAGGSSTQVQYNSSGVLAGSANLTFDGTTLTTLNTAYTGTLTGGTGVVNLGSGQFYKDASGNVGIGTSSPTYKLDVLNSASATLTTRIKNSSATGLSGILFDNNVSTASSSIAFNTSSNLFEFWTNSDNGFRWGYAGSSSSFTERMRIDSSGNLMVGTTNSSIAAGNGIKLLPSGGGTGVSTMSLVGNSSSSGQGSYHLYSSSLSQYQFYVTYDGTIAARSTSITGLSDISEKENIVDIDTGLNTVMQLKPRRFDWKNGTAQNVAGFIAQEVEMVMPDLVQDYKLNDEETKKGLKMGDMLPTLVKAIQELNAKVDAQAATITTLQAKVGN